MKLLVTGSTGFLGRHLVRSLVDRDNRVSVVVREDSTFDLSRFDSQAIDVHVHTGTTRQMVEIFERAAPECVVHLASNFVVRHSHDDIEPLITSNIRFGVQLLEAMQTVGVSHIVSASTSWQYFGQSTYRPVNLYAATKQAFEDLALYYEDAHNLLVTHMRLFDTYGPEDERAKLVPLLVRAARDGHLLEMSPGDQLIDLVHVDDVSSAFVAAAQRHCDGLVSGTECFSVSSGHPISLREIVAVMEQSSGRTLNVRFGARPYREREVMVPWSAGYPVPGWEPGVALTDGFTRLFEE